MKVPITVHGAVIGEVHIYAGDFIKGGLPTPKQMDVDYAILTGRARLELQVQDDDGHWPQYETDRPKLKVVDHECRPECFGPIIGFSEEKDVRG